ncbi:MAG: hypothetical protein KGO81_13395 [Bacteroidota bacterium]|nr:hypothetical protein [Bacteroidota bacterium]
MKNKATFLYWSPRIISILAIFFISIFAADAFAPGLTFWQQIGAFLLHLVPSFVLIGLLVIAWKWEFVGGVLFIAIGLILSSVVFMHNLINRRATVATSLGIIAVITFPFIVAGILFIANDVARKKKLLKGKV